MTIMERPARQSSHPRSTRPGGRLVPLAFLILAGCQAESEPFDVFAGAVSAATPEAADAGRDVLEAGGNAIDAAVAVAFALGVTEPASSGLGGQTVMLVHAPGEEPFVINGTSRAPAATPDGVEPEDLGPYTLTTVPTTVRVLDFAFRNHGSGTVPWSLILEPAIRAAEEGYVMGRFRRLALERYREILAASPTAGPLHLEADGSLPAGRTLVRQPLLASTLRRLAGAGANDFYHGWIAEQIAKDMASHGGWLSAEDLETTPEPTIMEPLHMRYRGHDVYTLPPPYGGWIVLQALTALAEAPDGALADGSPDRDRWLAEALRFGHRTRADEPVQDLLDYRSPVAERLDPARAREFIAHSALADDRGETTHFSVVDGDGMVVAVTQSINSYFGSRAASPDLGFLYNSYMLEYELGRPDHPFALRAGALPLSSMSGTVIALDGIPKLVLGSPGSARIISAVVQVVSGVLDAGRSAEAAVAAPRLHVVPGLPGQNDRLFMEGWTEDSPVPAWVTAHGLTLEAVVTSMTRNGMDPYFGGVHALGLVDGSWSGGADARRDGIVTWAWRPEG